MNNKIPPPIVTLIFGLCIYFSRPFFPEFSSPLLSSLSVISFVVGISVFVAAVSSFKKQKTTVYLFRRNIDVISHVLSRYKNFKKTSFRIRSLHEIINPFIAFIFRNFHQKEKLKLDDLWQEIFNFDIDRFEELYKINP